MYSEGGHETGDVEGDEHDNDWESEKELVLADALLLEKYIENIELFTILEL